MASSTRSRKVASKSIPNPRKRTIKDILEEFPQDSILSGFQYLTPEYEDEPDSPPDGYVT